MSIQNPNQIPEEDVEFLHTGQWYIARLDDPNIAAQGESKEEAFYKLKKRLEKYQDRRDRENTLVNDSDNRSRGIDRSVGLR